MLKTYLVTASIATMLATGALAQTATPAPQMPAAPTQTQSTMPSTAAPTTPSTTARSTSDQLTTSRIVGISIYAPKPDRTPATTGSTAAPGSTIAPTGGQMMITPVSDEQWRSMRDQHDSIGTISDLVVGADGNISHAVLGVGGFLGIGEKNVALPFGQVRLMRQSDGTLVGFITSTKQQLQEMQTFTPARS